MVSVSVDVHAGLGFVLLTLRRNYIRIFHIEDKHTYAIDVHNDHPSVLLTHVP